MSRCIVRVGREEVRPWPALAAAALLLVTPCARAADDPHRMECELGVALSLGGEFARAESVFVSLLSHSPGDARALTNLGNLHLLRGEEQVALRFYDQARAADSTDAGIVLNEATALLLAGDEEAAQESARLGVRMAGGTRGAASLLGLHYEGGESEAVKGAEKVYLSKEEVLSMLRAATGRVPADSTRVTSPPGTTGPAKGKKHVPQWRSAGPRAGEGDASATLVYWKR